MKFPRTKDLLRREGFWYGEHSPLLPKPIANEKAWKGRRKFLKALAIVEKVARPEHYKGYSNCRICKKRRNGTASYILQGWTWPEGFRHYVEEHNVRPSLAFQEFILGRSLDDDD